MFCLFLIDSVCVIGRHISPSVTHDTATWHKHTRTDTHTVPAAAQPPNPRPPPRTVCYHVGMITLVFNRCSITMATTFLLLVSKSFIALAAASTVYNAHAIVFRVLSLSWQPLCFVNIPLSWRRGYCHGDPSLPAQRPVR